MLTLAVTHFYMTGNPGFSLVRGSTGLARHKCASSSYARVRHPRAARPCARRSLTESGMLDVTVQVRYFSSPSFSNGIILRVDAKRDARASMLHPCCAHVQRASTAISVRCYCRLSSAHTYTPSRHAQALEWPLVTPVCPMHAQRALAHRCTVTAVWGHRAPPAWPQLRGNPV